MENATKALIIGGAILIAILLISFGMLILNSANTQIDDAVKSMDKNAKSQFNSTFMAYDGNYVSGSNVKQLISQVISHNRQMTQEGTIAKLVSVSYDSNKNTKFPDNAPTDGKTDISELNSIKDSKVVNGLYYIVKSYENSTTGLIDTIYIAEKKGE